MPDEKLTPEPNIDSTAFVQDSKLGLYTVVGARSSVLESELGDYTYLVDEVQVAYTEIGKFCAIASHARLNPGNHPMGRAALHHFTYRSRSYGLADEDDEEFFQWRRQHQVIVGNDVWIGHGATLMPGVKIGTGAAIGSGAIVTKDVPNFGIAVGVPAKLLRFRFDERVQEKILSIAWWNWTREQLKTALPEFRKLSAEEFAEKYA